MNYTFDEKMNEKQKFHNPTNNVKRNEYENECKFTVLTRSIYRFIQNNLA